MACEVLRPEMGGDPSRTNALPVTVHSPWGSMGDQQSSGQHNKSQPQPDIADDMILDGTPKTVERGILPHVLNIREDAAVERGCSNDDNVAKDTFAS